MVRRALFWAYAGQVTTFLISFIGSIFVARLLSPREMGVYGVAQAVIGIVQLATAFGVAAYVIREPDLTDDVIKTAFTINAALTLTLAMILALVSFATTLIFAEPEISSIIRLLAVLPVLSVFSFLPTVMLQRNMAFRGLSILGTAATAITTSVTVTSAWAGYSSLSPAYGALAGSAFASAVTLWIGRRHVRYGFSIKHWREMTTFGLRMMAIGGLATAAFRAGEIIIAHFLGLAALGLYNRASTLNTLIFNNVYGSATRVIFVQLSEAQRQQDQVAVVYVRGFRMITALIGPMLIGLAIMSGPIMQLLYGEKWLSAAPLLTIMLVSQFLSMSFAMNSELFIVRGKLKIQVKLETIRSVLSVIAIASGSMISLIAVAWSGAALTVVSICLYAKHMPRLIGIQRRDIYALYGEALSISAVAVAPVTLVMSIYGWSPDTPIGILAAMIPLGILVWSAILWQLEHPLCGELFHLIRKIRHKR